MLEAVQEFCSGTWPAQPLDKFCGECRDQECSDLQGLENLTLNTKQMCRRHNLFTQCCLLSYFCAYLFLCYNLEPPFFEKNYYLSRKKEENQFSSNDHMQMHLLYIYHTNELRVFICRSENSLLAMTKTVWSCSFHFLYFCAVYYRLRSAAEYQEKHRKYLLLMKMKSSVFSITQIFFFSLMGSQSAVDSDL